MVVKYVLYCIEYVYVTFDYDAIWGLWFLLLNTNRFRQNGVAGSFYMMVLLIKQLRTVDFYVLVLLVAGYLFKCLDSLGYFSLSLVDWLYAVLISYGLVVKTPKLSGLVAETTFDCIQLHNCIGLYSEWVQQYEVEIDLRIKKGNNVGYVGSVVEYILIVVGSNMSKILLLLWM